MMLAHCPIRTDGHRDGRWLLEQLCTRYTGHPMGQIQVTDRGKPYFPGEDLYFSISHTPRHVFCALSREPVGLDAEETDRQVNLKLAEKILSPGERQRFERDPEPRQALLRLWVQKEALLKLEGTGLRGYPCHTDFDPRNPEVLTCCGCFVAVARAHPEPLPEVLLLENGEICP